MADTNHQPARTEGDGINYRGLGMAMLILTAVTLVCYLIVWGFFIYMESRAASSDSARNALAAAPVTPTIVDGRIQSGNPSTTPLLVDEPVNLQKYREREHEMLTTYGWVDQNAETLRVPIEIAKDMILRQGLPVRDGGQ
jgi:hypothetical protein